MAKRWDVVCIGAAIVDIPLKPVDKNIFDNASYPVDRIAMSIGGDAINEATILSRLGLKVALNSLVGGDTVGVYILDFCKENGIDTDGIHIDKSIDTSINIGLVRADGERTFITNRNGSLWKMDMSHVRLDMLANAKLLSFASIFNSPLLNGAALTQIFKEAKKQGLIICADAIKSRLGEGLTDIAEALGYVDYFFPNYEEAAELTGKTELNHIADTFLELGTGNVIIKNGKKGCFIKNKDITAELPALEGITVRDTIGAGDNFVAGFISGILCGKSITECGEFANATASIAVEGEGATGGVQNLEQVNERYDTYLMKKEER